MSDYFIEYNDDIRFISLCSHNNVPETVPPEIRKLMQDNIDGNKDELVSIFTEAVSLVHYKQ